MFKRNKRINRNLCFVLMPFREKLEPVHRKIKEVVVLEHRLSCIRADNIYSTGIIIDLNRIRCATYTSSKEC